MKLVISHKGLRKLYEKGETKGVMQKHVPRLREILAEMEAAEAHEDMGIASWNKYHPLDHDLKGRWAVKVDKNWRVHFFQRFEDDGTPYFDLVEYEDYH